MLCCAHILNLCVRTDLLTTIRGNATLNDTHKRTMKKCNSIWKAVVHPKAAGIIQEILDFSPRRPGKTRWNSLYDALKDMIKM